MLESQYIYLKLSYLKLYCRRYINHSALSPNCRPRVIQSLDKEIHVVFVATKFIPRGEELLYTYHVHNGGAFNKDNEWYLTS
jgi:SET domain-containing protein